MKKLIGAIFILAILGGIAYFFLGNNMIMTTMISQNTEKKVAISNNAYKRLSEYSGYNFSVKTIETEDGVSDTKLESEILIQKDNANFYVKAEVKYDEGETTKTKTVYYEGTLMAGVIYQIVGSEASGKTSSEGSLEDALQIMTNENSDISLTDLIKYDANKTTKEEVEELDLKVKMAFSFKPFYFGLKFVTSDEEAGLTFTQRFDFGGSLRKVTFESKEENINNETSISINKPGKKVTFTKLTDEQKALFVD